MADGSLPPPLPPARSRRAAEVVTAARRVVERAGPRGLTMRAVADELGVKTPSLYKHVDGRPALEALLVATALVEVGGVLHEAVGDRAGGPDRVAALLTAYRRHALAHPGTYRLATAGPLDRDRLPPGLEEWAGAPFFLVTGEPHRAQALWAFAHGMVVLELDGRFPPASDLDRTWTEAAAAFASAPAGP